jgi:hypothetical protein
MKTFSFSECLAFADGHAPTVEAVGKIIADRIPGFVSIERADFSSDKDGTDFFITRRGNEALRLDLKLRGTDCMNFGADDLALETWSKIELKRVGWTRDERKNSDFILWFWKDTGRFFLVSFPCLCSVFRRFWEVWAQRYQTAIQDNMSEWERWQSQCVFVPRQIVLDAILKWQSSSVENLRR